MLETSPIQPRTTRDTRVEVGKQGTTVQGFQHAPGEVTPKGSSPNWAPAPQGHTPRAARTLAEAVEKSYTSPGDVCGAPEMG